MNDFTASNGVGIRRSGDGSLTVSATHALVSEATGRAGDGVKFRAAVFDFEEQALREFFQAEADERLGRWRWPENPDYVVYLVGDDVVDVLREASVSESTRGPGRKESITRAEAAAWDRLYSQNFYQAARAYFDAHPEPKPWQKAEAGELWELTVEGVARTYAAIASTGQNGVYLRFFPTHEVNAVTVGAQAPVITAGTRIFPEVSS